MNARRLVAVMVKELRQLRRDRMTLTMVLFTAVAIVRERERGNMELLITTPVGRAELMIGKVLPYVAIGLVQTSVVLLLGTWIFDVPIRGSVGAVYAAALLLIVANLSLGLLISTRARSQFQAMQMTFFVFLPSILLSGFMFPFAGMPVAAQWIAQALPLTHFMQLIRGVILRSLRPLPAVHPLWIPESCRPTRPPLMTELGGLETGCFQGRTAGKAGVLCPTSLSLHRTRPATK